MTDKKLSGKRVLTFVGDIYEDLELWYPKLRLIEEGAQVVVAGEEANRVYAGKNGYPCTSDVAISDMHESQFDAVLLPGGFMPDRLRRLESVKSLYGTLLIRRNASQRSAMEVGWQYPQTSIGV